MARSMLSKAIAAAAALFSAQTVLGQATSASSQTETIGTVTISGVASTYSVQYTPPASIDNGQPIIPNVEDPQAVNAQTVCPGYKASNVQHMSSGFTADLTLAGPACNVYGTDIDELILTVDYQDHGRLGVNVKPKYITAANATQYVLPDTLVELPQRGDNNTANDSDLQFVWSNDPSFSFQILRKSNGDTLFSTSGTVLVYENQFIEFVTALPENYNAYGAGEHIHAFRLGTNFTSTWYNVDSGDTVDTNLYGTHPFYLETRYYEIDNSTGKHTLVTGNATDVNAEYVSYSHGVYMRNSHGMEGLFQTNGLTWRSLGGQIDLYFFEGPTQPEVTKQYLGGAVGLPAMQQYFTFGYHQCRWGYANWSEVEAVVNNFKAANIPLETIWNDIDYMQSYRDFQNDPIRYSYSEGEAFLQRLHDNGQHYVPIVDSAIYIPNANNDSDAYDIYDEGHAVDAFLHNPDGSEYIGAVWPGYTVFPDWLSANASSWWTNSMVNWHKKIPFDGIWIDMSEVSSFCVGSCGSNDLQNNPIHPPFALPGEPGSVIYDYPEGFNVTNATQAASASAAASSQAAANSASAGPSSSTSVSYLRTTPTPGSRNINYPPYAIKNVAGDLAVHAVSPNATHQDGTKEYDVHNLWGYQILNATYHSLLAIWPTKRPFIIGRSTFAGAGKWAGHWGGDNYSQFIYMWYSIPQALTMSLFGIPMFGVDTCGFSGNSDEELCARWMALSSMFPFYRNHNTLSANSQEPYVWASVAEASRNAMAIRYSLLPYIYTLFHSAHTSGTTVMRALAWEFPNDPSLASADRQFLLGGSLLVTPVLEPNVRTVNGVFPGTKDGAIWYDWYNQSAISVAPGANVTIDAPLTHLPLYVRGGSVLPQQEARMTTAACRNSSWSVIAALDKDGSATGSLYVDDGESVAPNATLLVDFTVARNSLYASAVGTYVDANKLANVTVLGVQSRPGNVMFNGRGVGFEYDAATKVLSCKGLQDCTSAGAWSSDWVLSW